MTFNLSPYDYAQLASNRKESTNLRLYGIWRLQQLPAKQRKGKVKTLQKLQIDEDELVAKAATAALASIQPVQ